MRSKASLSLMEQLMMVLVFALCAALCLRVFAGARQISEETARCDDAVVIAQNAAEMLKAGCSPQETENLLTADGYTLEIVPQPSRIAGLTQVQITVFWDSREQFCLQIGYQEAEK